MRCVDAQANNDTGPAGDQTVSFTVTGANPQATEVATNAGGFAQFCYTGTNAGLDTITAFVDSNDNNTKDASEPQETATKRWLATQPAITLEPPTGRQPDRHHPHADRDRHRAAAPRWRTCRSGSSSSPAASTRASARRPATRFAVTDANGQATCTYTGSPAAPTRSSPSPTPTATRSLDTGEPSDTATKTWTEDIPPATSLSLTPPAATNVVNVQHCVTAIARLASGSPAANRSVRFTVTGANPQAETELTTDSGGATQFCYTGTNAGQDTITAFVDNDKRRAKGRERASDDGHEALACPAARLPRLDASGRNQSDEHAAHRCRHGHGRRQPDPEREGGFPDQGHESGRHEVHRRGWKGLIQLLPLLRGNGHDRCLCRHERQRHERLKRAAGHGHEAMDGAATELAHADPPSATNPINTEHCVTATVRDATNRLQGNRTVRFSVSGVNAHKMGLPRATSPGRRGSATRARCPETTRSRHSSTPTTTSNGE